MSEMNFTRVMVGVVYALLLALVFLASKAFGVPPQAPKPPQAPPVQSEVKEWRDWHVVKVDLPGGPKWVVSMYANSPPALARSPKHPETRQDAQAEADRLNDLDRGRNVPPCSDACTCGCQEGEECRCLSRETAAKTKRVMAERQPYRCGCSHGCPCQTCLCNGEDWCGAPGCRCGEAGANRVTSRIQRVSAGAVPAPVFSPVRPVTPVVVPTYRPPVMPMYQPPYRPVTTFAPMMSFAPARGRGRASGC